MIVIICFLPAQSGICLSSLSSTFPENFIKIQEFIKSKTCLCRSNCDEANKEDFFSVFCVSIPYK